MVLLNLFGLAVLKFEFSRSIDLYSAKEAFYKSQYCVTRKGLGFHDAVVRVEGDCFEVKLRKPAEYFRRRKEVLRGRFAISEAHVFAAIGLRVGSEIRSG